MKKKALWTVGIASAMAAGMAMTALAGWVQDGATWYYYKDSNNEMIRDEWVESNGLWYYLGNDGKMVTNRFIDDTYYVNANGVRLTNAWQMIYGDWDEDSGWRYFGANGKAYTSGIKEIDGVWYHFDDTVMSTGWVEEDDKTYYFNDSGSRVSGWKQLPDPDEDEWGEYWYYFSSNGRMLYDTEKKIDGVTYLFDDEGRMLTGWVNPSDYTSSERNDLSNEDPANLMFIEDSGAAAEGWHYLAAPDGADDDWYYFKDGKAYTVSYKTTEVGSYGIAKIQGEYYCFNEHGQMETGLIEAEDNRYFYFDEDNGVMRTGRVVVNDENYDNQEFYFATSGSVGERGEGVTGVKDGRLYEYGMLVAADDGMKYEKVTVAGETYLVNEQGKIKTSGTAKDADGVKYKVTKENGSYVVAVIDD